MSFSIKQFFGMLPGTGPNYIGMKHQISHSGNIKLQNPDLYRYKIVQHNHIWVLSIYVFMFK